MGDVINLRQARKQKARAGKDAAAAANRAKFGRTKADKQQAAQDELRKTHALDQARLDKAPPDTK